ERLRDGGQRTGILFRVPYDWKMGPMFKECMILFHGEMNGNAQGQDGVQDVRQHGPAVVQLYIGLWRTHARAAPSGQDESGRRHAGTGLSPGSRTRRSSVGTH